MRALVVVLALTLGVGGASAEPRVSLNAAEKTALARVPGKVFAAKLKTKKKFPHPVWSLKIEADKGARKKVSVDSESGKIVEIKELKPKKDDDDDDDK